MIDEQQVAGMNLQAREDFAPQAVDVALGAAAALALEAQPANAAAARDEAPDVRQQLRHHASNFREAAEHLEHSAGGPINELFICMNEFGGDEDDEEDDDVWLVRSIRCGAWAEGGRPGRSKHLIQSSVLGDLGDPARRGHEEFVQRSLAVPSHSGLARIRPQLRPGGLLDAIRVIPSNGTRPTATGT